MNVHSGTRLARRVSAANRPTLHRKYSSKIRVDFPCQSTLNINAILEKTVHSPAAPEEAPVSSATSSPGQVVAPKKSPGTLRSIVFVTSEVAPWSKTGGLADVASSLPAALAARGHRVMVVAPLYDKYPEAVDTKKRVEIMSLDVGYYHHRSRDVDWVFVDHPSFPRPGGIYADMFGVYGDNQFRFMLLALAALEAPLQLDLGPNGRYGEEVMFIANDWHAALVPVYLAAKFRPHNVYRNARCIVAIHNLCHQGVFPPSSYASLGLPDDWYTALEWQYPPHQRQGSYEEEGRAVNHLKAGLATADRLVTVSPGYAEEIRTYLGGWGMEALLEARHPVLNGIVNGIDLDEWDPATDPHLPMNYDITNFKEGKAACKAKLQAELGLPVRKDVPLIAFIGRLDSQKGADILLSAAHELLVQNDVQLVCLGSGNKDLEDGLRWMEATYYSKARGWVGFNVPLSHRLTAAADLLLMPSRFEPCGLNQLYAMRYGAVPIAHATGGLRDTVINFDPWKKTGTGWTYTSCDAGGLLHTITIALRTFKHHQNDFEELQKRGMSRESSWDTAAASYEQIMDWAAMDPPYCK